MLIVDSDSPSAHTASYSALRRLPGGHAAPSQIVIIPCRIVGRGLRPLRVCATSTTSTLVDFMIRHTLTALEMLRSFVINGRPSTSQIQRDGSC